MCQSLPGDGSHCLEFDGQSYLTVLIQLRCLPFPSLLWWNHRSGGIHQSWLLRFMGYGATKFTIDRTIWINTSQFGSNLFIYLLVCFLLPRTNGRRKC